MKDDIMKVFKITYKLLLIILILLAIVVACFMIYKADGGGAYVKRDCYYDSNHSRVCWVYDPSASTSPVKG